MSTRAVTADAPAASEPISEFLPTDKNYRLTGELPAETEERSARSAEDEEQENEHHAPSNEEDPAPSNSDTAAASEAAPEQQEKEAKKPKTSATSESRWAKITRENRELRERLDRIEKGKEKEGVREDRQESHSAAENKTEAKANAKPKIDDVDPKTGKPKYASYADYEDARDEWNRKEAVREFEETSTKSEREKAQQAQQKEIAESLNKKFNASRAKHADFDEVALNPDLTIPIGSVTDGFLQDSDHTGEVAYYLGQHPEILEGFYGDFNRETGKFTNKISPQRQFRKLMEIESEVSGGAARKTADETAEEKAATTSTSSTAKPVTQATRPAHQTSGKGAVTKDAVEQAIEDGDSETYMREQNSRALARLTKKGK